MAKVALKRGVARFAALPPVLLAAAALATEPPTPLGTDTLSAEPPPATAGQSADASFPPPLPSQVVLASGRRELYMLGYGHFRKLLWDIFDISLWIAGEQWSFNEPFALELRYLRDVKGTEIVEGTRDQWEHLHYPESMTAPWLEQLTGVFPDVKKGDQLAGVYLPGRPTRFFRNGEPIGVIDDPEFGRAFFSIWLDERTSQPKLRLALLGNGCRVPLWMASAGVRACGGATMRAPDAQRQSAAPL